MDSHKPKTQEDTSKKTLDAPPPPTAAANPNFTTSNASSSSNPISDEAKGEGAGAKEEQKAAVPLASVSTGAATDMEKKMRRAERFGVAVVMSEEEKRNTRAERFGTAPVSVRTGGTGQLEEEQKRKARAERFGLSSTNASVDEEAKKKARIERFSKGSKVDASEEEKRKTRALRFSENSTSLSQPSAKESSELNKEAASVAGTA